MADFSQALRSQRHTLWALIVREYLILRGVNRWGYVAALLQPLLLMTFFIGLRILRSPGRFPPEIIPSLVIGFLLFFGFRSAVVSGLTPIATHTGVFFVAHIRPLDLALARIAVQWYIHLFSLAFLLLGVHFLFMPFKFTAWEYLATGPVLIIFLSVGVGVFARALGVFYPVSKKIIRLLMMLLFWFSGVFYSPAALGPTVGRILEWNPVTVCLELTRAGIGLVAMPQQPNIAYVLLVAFISASTGLLLNRYLWREFHL